MKNKYWAMYYNFVKIKHYFQICKKEASIIDRTLSIGTAVVSSASIASWLIWQDLTVVWAVILGLSTIVSIIKLYLPYEKRVSAISYLLPELKNLINEVEHYYNSMIYLDDNSANNIEINKNINTFKQAYTKLENKFIDDAIFPHSERIDRKSDKRATAEMTTNYYINPKELNGNEKGKN